MSANGRSASLRPSTSVAARQASFVDFAVEAAAARSRSRRSCRSSWTSAVSSLTVTRTPAICPSSPGIGLYENVK
jgi:hypothetical protein